MTELEKQLLTALEQLQ
ncbi:MbeD/MobD family mobilization/exclusion protein, partial [Klebsiella pneumoniae]